MGLFAFFPFFKMSIFADFGHFCSFCRFWAFLSFFAVRAVRVVSQMTLNTSPGYKTWLYVPLDHPVPFSEAYGGPIMAQNSTKNVPSWPNMALHDPKWPFMTPNGPSSPQKALKHFSWVYNTILGHAGPPWGLFRGPLGPCGPLKRPQGGPIWHIVMYYALRNFLGPFGVMQRHFGSWIVIFGHEGSSLKHHFGPWRPILGHKGPFLCCFGSFWGPHGLLRRPQGGPTWHIIM